MILRSHKAKELAPALDNINNPNRKSKKKQVTQQTMDGPNGNQANANGNLHGDVLINANDEPNNYNNRQGIAPPPITRPDFEIKNSLLQPIQKNLFHGYADENPFKHIQRFQRICDLTKTEGVSEDAFKLRLFPFSLGEPASEWENELEPGTITTWEQCKQAFLERFYTQNRTANIRNEITSFEQRPLETFSEAWTRFKKYLSDCPHHNFQRDTLLSTFYRGLLAEDKKALNASSGGNFLMCTVTEGTAVIDRLAKADAGSHPDYDRKKQPLIGNANKDIGIKSLSDKLDKLLSGQSRNFEVNMIGEGEDVQNEEVAYVQNNYRGNQPFNNYRNNNLSYRSNNVANPEDQTYPQQKQQFQPKPYVPRQAYQQQYQQPFQPQPQYPPPIQPYQPPPPADHTALLNQLLKAQTALIEEVSSIKNDFNRKLDNSHRDLSTKFEQLSSRMMHIENNNASTSGKQKGQLPGGVITNPRDYNVSAFTVSFAPVVPVIDEDKVSTEDSKVEEGEIDEIVKNLEVTKMKEEEREVDNAGRQMVIYKEAKKPTTISTWIRKGTKDMLKTFVPRQLQLTHQKAPLVMEKPKGNTSVHITSIVDKMDDPGTFSIPCVINGWIFKSCLCDLGASISMMPLAVAYRLGLTNYVPTEVTLTLADQSVIIPEGVIENVPIKIGKVTLPTDFVVVNMEEVPLNPIILGRPFLASAGTLIDVKIGRITLILGKQERLSFDLNGNENKPKIKGQAFQVKEVDKSEDSEKKETIKKKNKKEKGTSNKIYFELEPNGMVNGSMEYKVKGGRPPKPYEIISLHMAGYKDNLLPTGPFKIKNISSNGSLIVSGDENKKQPFNGQRVKLYVADTETDIQALDLGPEYEIKPTGVVDGALEYTIRGVRIPNPYSKIKQLLRRSQPDKDWSGPFAIQETPESKTITLVSLKESESPPKKRKARVYLSTEHTKEETTVPLISE